MASRKIEVEILGDASSLDRALGKSQQSTSKFGKGLKVASIGAVGALGAIGLGLKKSADAAMEAEVSQTRMQTQLKALGISYQQHSTRIDDVIQSTSKLAALDDEDLQGAFTRLVRATGSVNDALRDTKLAADVARGANVSLEAATKAISNAELGRVTGLKKLGVEIVPITAAQDALRASHEKVTDAQMASAKATDAAATKQAALAALQKSFAGAAESYGNSSAGASDRFQVAIENLEESLGKFLLPTLARVGNALAAGATFLSEHTTAAKIAIGVIAGLSAGVLAVSAAMKVATAAQAIMTAAQWALNAALTANPIGLVIVAVAALGAAVVIAYQRSETFRNVVSGAFQAVRAAVATAVSGILTGVDQFLGALQSVFTAASHIPFVGDKFRGVADKIGVAREGVRNLQGSIDSLHGKDIDITTHYHETRDFAPSSSASGGGGSFGPGRAAGGPVLAGMSYTVGERGRERFVPATDGVIIPHRASQAAGGWGGGDIVVQISGETLFRISQKEAARYARANGAS